MKLYNILTTTLNEKYLEAHVTGTREYAPRPGCFFIREVYFKQIKLHGEVPMAKVNWKGLIDSPFIEDVVFDIALSNLYPANPSETIDFKISDLIGKTIHVYHPMLVRKFINGTEREVLNCTWSLVNTESIFINKKNASIHAFKQGATSLNEANQNFITSSPFDLSEAEYEEGIKSSFGDSYVEDVNHSLDDLDGDIGHDNEDESKSEASEQ